MQYVAVCYNYLIPTYDVTTYYDRLFMEKLYEKLIHYVVIVPMLMVLLFVLYNAWFSFHIPKLSYIVMIKIMLFSLIKSV